MKIKITNDDDGCPKVEVIDDAGEVTSCTELGLSKQVTLETSGEGNVTVGEVTPSE